MIKLLEDRNQIKMGKSLRNPSVESRNRKNAFRIKWICRSMIPLKNLKRKTKKKVNPNLALKYQK